MTPKKKATCIIALCLMVFLCYACTEAGGSLAEPHAGAGMTGDGNGGYAAGNSMESNAPESEPLAGPAGALPGDTQGYAPGGNGSDPVSNGNDHNNDEPETEPEPEPEPLPDIVTLTISAAGDVTLGGDRRGNGYHAFMRELENSGDDYTYFLGNVRQIFEEDDLTIVNLEGSLTDAMEHLNKPFAFRGEPRLARILSSSSVEAVSLANNHSGDHLNRGYIDTTESLEAEGVTFFGNEFVTILEIKGVNVGLFGFLVWNDGQANRNKISDAIEDLQERGADLIIAYFHWGDEGAHMPSAYQRALGRFAIDSGSDLVLGSHPHVLQGIETYNGKNIVYCLGNFCFGGNSNPPDQDTMIFQQTFTFIDGMLQETNEVNIIPARISSIRGRNNFQPTVAEGEDGERILRRIDELSNRLT